MCSATLPVYRGFCASFPRGLRPPGESPSHRRRREPGQSAVLGRKEAGVVGFRFAQGSRSARDFLQIPWGDSIWTQRSFYIYEVVGQSVTLAELTLVFLLSVSKRCDKLPSQF